MRLLLLLIICAAFIVACGQGESDCNEDDLRCRLEAQNLHWDIRRLEESTYRVEVDIFSRTIPSEDTGRRHVREDFTEITCKLHELRPEKSFWGTAFVGTIDAAGNRGEDRAVRVRVEPDTAATLNCEEQDLIQLDIVADFYEVDPILQ